MTRTIRRLFPTAALLLCGAALSAQLGAPAAHASGPGQYSYSVAINRVVTQQLDAASAPCGVESTITMNQRLHATVVTTVPGLSASAAASLVDADPDGIVRQIHITASGTITIAQAVHTYAGRFTQQFSGNFMPNGMYVQTGTISVTGKSELGTAFRFNGGGHDLDNFDGVTVHFNSHESGDGCLS